MTERVRSTVVALSLCGLLVATRGVGAMEPPSVPLNVKPVPPGTPGAETTTRIGAWNELGRDIATRFLAAAADA